MTDGQKRTIYFECTSGISGDMLLGALLDLGVKEAYLRSELAKLGLEESYSLDVKKVERSGIFGTNVDVLPHIHRHHHSTFSDIRDLIFGSALSENVKEKSVKIFHLLAKAEAAVHRQAVDTVAFHEVGAIDSILDIVGAVIAMQGLGQVDIYTSEVHDGRGCIECQHGLIPVPVPAVARLLERLEIPIIIHSEVKTEMVTPTGLAILGGIGAKFLGDQPFLVKKSGYGFGDRETGRFPALRVMEIELVKKEVGDATE